MDVADGPDAAFVVYLDKPGDPRTLAIEKVKAHLRSIDCDNFDRVRFHAEQFDSVTVLP
jgi:hypothetical protein